MDAEKVRAILAQRKMTQKQLADALGMTEGGLCHWLSGRTEPSAHKLKRLCEILGCKAEDVW